MGKHTCRKENYEMQYLPISTSSCIVGTQLKNIHSDVPVLLSANNRATTRIKNKIKNFQTVIKIINDEEFPGFVYICLPRNIVKVSGELYKCWRIPWVWVCRFVSLGVNKCRHICLPRGMRKVSIEFKCSSLNQACLGAETRWTTEPVRDQSKLYLLRCLEFS